MKGLRQISLLVFGFLVLPACTFSAPQFEAFGRQVRVLVTSEKKTEEVVWLASLNGQGAVLKPYVSEGYTVFANESGDAVAFDGWVVRSVLGFGREHALRVADTGWVRSSQSHNVRFAATCSAWQKEASDEGYQWRQICGINGHEIVIDIDNTGNIVRVRQAFGGELGSLDLYVRP